MSAAADGVPYGLWIYTSSEGGDAIRAFYDEFAKRRALRAVDARAGDKETLAFGGDGGHQIFISIGEKDGQSYVTITEAGSLEHPSIAGIEVSGE
jgi:hypothetical protein